MSQIESPVDKQASAASKMPRLNIDVRMVLGRVKAVCLSPNNVWQEVKSESGTTRDFYRRYFFLIFAIPALGTLLRGMFHAHLFEPLGMAMIQYLAGLIGLLVVAIVAKKVAPRFGGQTDRVSAVKLFGFSMIPGNVAGALTMFGGSMPVTLLQLAAALYSLKIVWNGTPVLTTVPAANRLKYLGSVLAAVLVCWALAAALICLVGLRPGAG